MHSWRLRFYGDVNYTRPVVICSVEGCSSRHKSNGLCQTHLRRFRKGLPLDGNLRTLNPKRYKQLTLHGHFLADVRGRVYAHRVALYEQIGNARVPCFWCAAPLEWFPEESGKCEPIHVDHLDHDRHNNAWSNVVPSCNGCNAGRMLFNSKVRTPQYMGAALSVGS
jgi:hypothetical protein